MSKKTFVVDGKEFESKAQYRDYMIATYYSFKNKSGGDGGNFVKNPGNISGQPFEISDCENSTLIVMDHTEQVQIDLLKSCKVFIGACSSSIFIRDCSNCIFYVCTRQLRFRDCHNCVVYSFCQAEIHIEQSTKMQFGCFIGGYSSQNDHFAVAGLNVQTNQWSCIFDHNDPQKTGVNWKILTEVGEPWYPDSSGSSYVPLSSANQPGRKEESDLDGQVGQSFSFDQLIADNKSLGRHDPVIKHQKCIEVDVTKLGDDVALLVVYAEAQGINLLEMLSKDSTSNSKSVESSVPATTFSSNLLQLAFKLSISADESSRKELESATSESSLKTILELCRDDHGSKGNPHVDIKYFLKLCKKKYSILTEAIDEGEVKEPLQELSFVMPATTAKSRYEGDANDTSFKSSFSASSSAASVKAEDNPSYLGLSKGRKDPLVLNNISSILPIPSKSDNRAIDSNPSSFILEKKALGNPDSPIKISSETIVPSSPYDEEIQFSDDDDVDVEESNYSRSRSGRFPYNRRDNTATASSARTGIVPMESMEPADRFKPKDAMGPKIQSERDLEEKLFGSSPNKKAIERLRSHSAPKPFKRVSRAQKLPAEPEDKERQIALLQEMVEEAMRSTVMQTELYHKIQVHLGFIDAYTMIPPRGEIVVSKPRAWLSIQDIISAFEAGRCKLNEIQVQIMLVNVSKFAKEIRSLEKASVVYQSIDRKKPLTEIPAVKNGPKLNAQWLKKYLASLRLLKRSKSPTAIARSTASLAATRLGEGVPSNQAVSQNQSREALSRSNSAMTRKRASSVTSLKASSSSLTDRIRRKSLTASASDNQARASANTLATSEPESIDNPLSGRIIPIQWEEWLGTKVLDDKLKREEKPKEFRRALAGLSSSLPKDEINQMLQKFQIIPEDVLDEEIGSRIRRWILDIDGRRDFRHELNLELQRRHLKEKVPFDKLSKEKKRALLQSLKHKLISAKTEELKISESKEQAITLELFWKYRDECDEMKYQGTNKWGDWLKLYRSKADDAINRMEENIDKRKELLKREAISNEAVIPIQDLATAVDNAASTGGIPMSNALELRRSFVALRKESAKQSARGDGHGIDSYSMLVSKSTVNKHLGFVIAPIFAKLTDDLKSLADRARQSHDDLLRSTSSSRYFNDRKEAASRAVELESESAMRKSDSFKKWLKMKEAEKLKAVQSAVSADEHAAVVQ
jgi:hypothetical protein